MARMIVSGLEGAMLVARPFDDIERFQQSAGHLLSGLRVAPPRAAGRRAIEGAAIAVRRSLKMHRTMFDFVPALSADG